MKAGERLGPYEVLAPLGAGGMGEVYRARDTRLQRDVAIKIVPDLLGGPPDRLARFRREAQLLASLNHPNIGSIYGFEEVGEGALVLELVEGPTLAERLSRGALPIDEALPIARQVVDALEAAHARGIVHRDLKPSNIKVRPDGTVKVLDFGLAKALDESAGADLPMAATRTSPALTHAGIILGTAAYMAPEQAKGREVDARADIWAFGCVLYEMLTGASPFGGESISEVLAAVLRSEPEWRQLPADTPEAVRRLLLRCLQKDPARRLQHIGDARLELDDAAAPADTGDGARSATGRGRRERLAWATAGMLALAAVALGVKAFSRPLAPETRLEITTPSTADPFAFAISPDGRKVVFVARANGRPQLYLRAFDSAAAEPLPGTEMATFPFWSPDGNAIGFFADTKVKRFAIDSRSISTIATRAGAPHGGAWNADGTIVFAPRISNQLRRVAASGGNAIPVTKPDPQAGASHRFPHFLPGGRHFLYYVTGSPETMGVYAASLDGWSTKRILEANTPAAYSPTGHILYVMRGRLLAQPFDAKTLTLRGDAFVVAEDVAWEQALPAVSVSANGTIVYRSGPIAGLRQQFAVVDRSGKELDRIGGPLETRAWSPALSPDGARLAIHRAADGNVDVWWFDTSRPILTRLTSSAPADIHPLWSPDGSEVIYASRLTGVYDLYRRSIAGHAKELPVLVTAASKRPLDWSRDGRYLLYLDRTAEETSGADIWALPLAGGKPFAVLETEFEEMHAQFAPDSKWIAYESDKSGRWEIYVRSFPTPGQEWVVSTGGGSQARWRPDGGELFYIGLDGRLMAAPVRGSPAGGLDIGVPAPLFDPHIGPAVQPSSLPLYSVFPDSKRFLILKVLEDEVRAPLAVLMNWKPKS